MPTNKEDKELLASFPDSILSEKFLRFWDYPPTNTQSDSDVDNRIAYDIYGYTDRSPVYYREEYSDQAMEIFSHSEQFKTLQREFDQCIQQLSDWANEQDIIILDGDREHPAEYFLRNFLERLKGSYYPAEDRAELYNDGKKQLERIVLFLRRVGIDLDFRKAQVINLLSDGGLNQCSAGCIVRIQGVAHTLADHEDLTSLGLIKQFIAKVAEKSSVSSYKALCKLVGLTAEGNAIHAYSYLLERLKLELGLKFLDIPKDSFLSLFKGPYHRDSQIRESIDKVYKDYVIEFQEGLTATRFVQFIISRLSNPPYLFAQQLINWIGKERGQAVFDAVLNELVTLEGDVMPPETSKTFVMTITDGLFDNGFFDIDTALNSRLFFIGNYFYEHNPAWRKGVTWKPFSDNYKIYYSNIALSWINIDNEKQLIVDLIAKEEGLAELKSVLPNLESMDIANTLIQTPDDLNRFFEQLSPSRRFEAFQWLIVSLDLDPGNHDYTEWKPFDAIKTLYSLSPYIKKFAKLLKFLTQANRKSFIVDFIAINSNDIKENLQKKIFSDITITEEISHLPAEIVASHTLRCLLKDLIALGFKDFSNIQFANYRYPSDPPFFPVEDKPTYLDGIDFSHCSFVQAQVEVDVEGCSFQQADLHKAKFSGRIERADFQDASLIDTSFKESRYVIPNNANYLGEDFAGALFSTMSFKEVFQLFVDNKRHPASSYISFKGVDLSAVDFRDSDIRALIALLPKETSLSFVRTKLRHIYLEKYSFPTVLFNYANLENAHFSQVNFERIYFYEAILKNSYFIRCDLSKSDLLSAKKLEGIRLTETILVSDQLFKLYKRDVRDFSSVFLQDSLLSETFMEETLSDAKLSSQIFEYLIKNNFKNFQGADLSVVSFELFTYYQTQQELNLNFDGAQLPQFTHSFCSHLGERRKRSLYRCLILDTDVTRLADRAHLDIDEKTLFDEELFIKLINTSARGVVISVADQYAILLAMTGERTQKLIITDHRMEALEGIRILLSLAREASTQEMWLRAIEARFPLEKESFRKQINQWGNSVDFAHLKKALAYHLILFFPLGGQTKVFADELRQELGSERIAAVYLGDHGLRDAQLSQNILTLLDPDTELYRRDSFFDPKISYYRAFTLKNTVFDYSYLTTVNIIFDLINQLEFCRQKLSVFVHLSSDWVPIVGTVTPLTDHQEQIEFFNVQTQETSVQLIVGRRFTQFREMLEGLYKKAYEVLKTSIKPHKELSGVRFNFEKAMSVIPDIIKNSETVDGLNSAFAIQALFHYVNREQFRSDERNVLSIALQIHAYLNLAQIAHGSLADLANIIKLTQTLLREEVLLTERSSLFAFSQGFKQFVGGGFNLLLGTSFIVLDSIELSQAQTSALKAAFGSQLAFDSANLALAGGAVGAGLLGYSTITLGLGGVATLLGGLAVGINGLVQAYTEVAQKSEAIGAYFYRLDQAYLKGGYERVFSKEGKYFMKPYDPATIVALNFRDRSVIYDSSYLYPSYTRFGSGWNNLITWGGLPRTVKNKSQAINIRERLGYPEKGYFTAMDSWIETLVWVLPNTPSVYFSYGWNLLPGALLRRDDGFSLLRKLEEKYDFHFDFYLFPGAYIISSLVGSRVYTPVHIYLDESQRVLIMPPALKDIHYQIETSLTSGGQCVLFLNGEASVTLTDHHADYTWILDSENLSTDHLSFTTEGIKVGGVSIILQQPKAHYFFIDKKEGTFKLDFVKQKARLLSVDYQVFKKQIHLLETYIDRQTVDNRESIIKVIGYPFLDEKRKRYRGTAYYYPRKKHYLYTKNMPQEITKESELLYFDETSAYFYSRSLQLLWRTNHRGHYLERGYLLISLLTQELIVGSELYVSEGIVSMTRKDSDTFLITQSFTTLFSLKEKSPYKERKSKSKRQVVYELTRDQFILKRIADSRLLGALSYYFDKEVDVIVSIKTRKVCLYRSIFSGKVERGNLLKLGISEGNLSGFKDIKDFLQRDPWRDYPSLRRQFVPAQIDRFVELTSFSGKGRLGPLLVSENGPHNYTVINPKIKEKDVSYLGSLLMPSQKQAFYFFVPENSFSMCHIYRQAEGGVKALSINLNEEDIQWIAIQSNTLFFLNKGGILKKVDAFGSLSIVGFTKKWVNATENWINATFDYVAHYSDQPMERYLRVWGITDKRDRALTVWYDTENEMFAFMRPPSRSNGQPFFVSYLGMISDAQFFYSENKHIYYRTNVSQTNAELDCFFGGAQLQKSIQSLKMLPVFVTKVYLRYQKIWFEIPEGFLFSFDPQEASTWFLEKIYEDVFVNLGQHTSTLQKMTAIRFLANIYKEDISLRFRNDSLIPIQRKSGIPKLWWNAGKELIFQVPKREDAREWHYLGESQDNTVCFFSPKEKKVYLISHTIGLQEERPYRTMSSEFAIRMGASVLFSLDASKTDFSLLPQLKETKVLGLQISAVDSFYIRLKPELMNYYQAIFYQPVSPQKNVLIFDKEGDIVASRRNQTVIISHIKYACQFIFPEAMQEERFDFSFQRTVLQIRISGVNDTQLYEEAFPFIRSRLRSISINEEHILALPIQWQLKSNESLSVFPKLSHQQKEYLTVESSLYPVNTVQSPSKSNSFFKNILSNLGKIVGGVGTVALLGGSFLFVRRFIRDRSGIGRRVPSIAATLPLLERQGVQAKAQLRTKWISFFHKSHVDSSSFSSQRRTSHEMASIMAEQFDLPSSLSLLTLALLKGRGYQLPSFKEKPSMSEIEVEIEAMKIIDKLDELIEGISEEREIFLDKLDDEFIWWGKWALKSRLRSALIQGSSIYIDEGINKYIKDVYLQQLSSTSQKLMLEALKEAINNISFNQQTFCKNYNSASVKVTSFYAVKKDNIPPVFEELNALLPLQNRYI